MNLNINTYKNIHITTFTNTLIPLSRTLSESNNIFLNDINILEINASLSRFTSDILI